MAPKKKKKQADVVNGPEPATLPMALPAADYYRLKLMFHEDVLGSQPGNKTVAADFMRNKAIDNGVDPATLDIEAETLPETMEKGTTIFHRDEDGNPLIYCYQVKGMLKGSADKLNGLGGIKALSNRIQDSIFFVTRRMLFHGEMGEALERPLRAMTQQGPRISLARSERMLSGCWFECIIKCFRMPKFYPTEEVLRILLDYSANTGFGQWRNSGLYGQFEYELTAVADAAGTPLPAAVPVVEDAA